jgi:hypothetical protein
MAGFYSGLSIKTVRRERFQAGTSKRPSIGALQDNAAKSRINSGFHGIDLKQPADWP